jgi:hypothetical protein
VSASEVFEGGLLGLGLSVLVGPSLIGMKDRAIKKYSSDKQVKMVAKLMESDPALAKQFADAAGIDLEQLKAELLQPA